ncbi:class II aldolase/adducin family protein [Methylophilaceae bacterium]|jgi:L-fuculose-phosphate aldolase|nr:class II aldolase/adducin family protein [Methylophilaceae bacterium]|tara:strand:- start:8 stop:655 length:648 start_codon:yes stop_codon:yes gene_type:complete
MINARENLLNITNKLLTAGLNHGATGNCSCRDSGGFLITPTGVDSSKLTTDMMVRMNLSDNLSQPESKYQPSSEWQFHQAILEKYPEINAVVHTHSVFASSLSVLGQEIPAFHYMIAVAGGNSVRCAPYAMFGTKELSDNILEAIKDRKACLLSNHGLVAIGKDLNEAFNIAEEVEHLCRLFIEAKKIGDPLLLSDKQMTEVLNRFNSYSRWVKD